MVWKKLLPALFLICALLLFYFSGANVYLNFETLRAYHLEIKQWVQENTLWACLLFIVLYCASTALSLPFGIYLTVFAGYLFLQPFSTLYVALGATLGASLLYFVAKYATDAFTKPPALEKMRSGFQENAASYLLFLRLVPLFPFWLVNLAPALLGVPYRTFLWTTALGIIPGTFAFTQVGRGLGAVFESGERFSLDAALNSDVKIALVALALMALIPPVAKYVRKRTSSQTPRKPL